MNFYYYCATYLYVTCKQYNIALLNSSEKDNIRIYSYNVYFVANLCTTKLVQLLLNQLYCNYMRTLYTKITLFVYIIAITKRNFVSIVFSRTFVIICVRIVLTTIRKCFATILSQIRALFYELIYVCANSI